MLDVCLFVVLLASDPPASAPAPVPAASESAPAPAASPSAAPVAEPSPATALPDPQWEERGLRVAKPGYDLGLDEVRLQKPNGTQYRLTARQWRDLVREDPELWRLHVRGRLLVPGLVFTSVGAVWLSISAALSFDGVRSESATGALFQWGFPIAMGVTGVAMTIVGATARRRLHEHRRRIFVGPHASRQGGGISFVGRF